MRTALVAMAGLLAAGCGTNTGNGMAAGNDAAMGNAAEPAPAGGGAQPAGSGRATASLASATGEARGTSEAVSDGGGIRLAVAAQGLAPGSYGVHLHQTGQCEGPKFESAGPHWNPTNRQHGRDNPQGAHLGDLPNLEIGADGRGTLSFRVAGASLSGGTNPLLDPDGAAVMIHAAADDYRTDPSGNSGDRIACGVLRAAG